MTETGRIRPLDPSLDLDWAAARLDAEFGGRMQARRGELVDALEGPGLVVVRGGERVGLLTWFVGVDGADAEIAPRSERAERGVCRICAAPAH